MSYLSVYLLNSIRNIYSIPKHDNLPVLPTRSTQQYTANMFIPIMLSDVPYTPQYRSLLYARTKQGKVAELRQELQSGATKKDKMHNSKKIALKKIVANMTMSNNDMISLFPDVVGCMHIPSLEIKKMSVNSSHTAIIHSERD